MVISHPLRVIKHDQGGFVKEIPRDLVYVCGIIYIVPGTIYIIPHIPMYKQPIRGRLYEAWIAYPADKTL